MTGNTKNQISKTKLASRRANIHKLTEKTSTSLSLTVTLSGVEGCLNLTFIENMAKLNDIDI